MSLRRRNAAAKKVMVIKPFEDVPKVPEDFKEKSWDKLQKAVRSIFGCSRIEFSKEELYKTVSTMCLQDERVWLYEHLKQMVDAQVEFLVNELNSQEGEASVLLNELNTQWKTYISQVSIIRSIFMYLERDYMLQNGLKTITDLCYTAFKNALEKVPEVLERLVSSVLHLINQERSEEMDHRLALKDVNNILTTLGLYWKYFEPKFLKETQEFFEKESKAKSEAMRVPEYLRHVEKRMKEEYNRLTTYLDPSTSSPVMQLLESHLIAQRVEFLLEKGLKDHFDNNRIEDFKRMYALFQKCDQLEPLKVEFAKVLKERGKEIASNQENRKEIIPNLLQLRTKVNSISSEAFKNNYEFKFAIKGAWENFMNLNSKIAELCAQDLDNHLRKSGKYNLRDEEFENHVNEIIELFRYISAKDIFEAFYQKKLAKRLLLEKSRSDEAEKSVIAKLKAECGSTFTNRIHNMYKDIETSKLLMESFREAHESQLSSLDIDFNVVTLTGSVWPPQPKSTVTLPSRLLSLQSLYNQFYTQSIKRRVLSWQASMSHCVLKANFKSSVKDLCVSLHQAVILLLYNSKDSMSFGNILSSINISEEIAKREILPLTMKKHRILTKTGKSSETSPEDLFTLNQNFASKFRRIVINSLQIKETKQETNETIEKVISERQYIIDAAIVRIMKTRKKLSHNELVSEVFSQLQFPLQSSDVKKRIENLIERDYLERDENDRALYHYIS